jgi:hypothetical protein
MNPGEAAVANPAMCLRAGRCLHDGVMGGSQRS